MHQLTEHVKWSRPAWPKILCSWLSYALWEITGQVLSLHLQCVAPRVVPLLFLHTCVIWNIRRTTVSAMAGQQTLLNYFCVGTYFTGVTIPLNSQTKNGLRVFMLNAACSDRVQLILCLIKRQHIVAFSFMPNRAFFLLFHSKCPKASNQSATQLFCVSGKYAVSNFSAFRSNINM